jgi:catechol 2,3-dioxygenase-like lactoylglutathione lyase family enzyme
VSRSKLLGIELIVHEMSSALALLVDALGLELVDRFVSTDPAGEVAVLEAGDIAVTLLQPAGGGPGFVLPKREPRLAQIVFGVSAEGLAGVARDLAASGVPTQVVDDARFFVPPASVEGALGLQTAVVVTRADVDTAPVGHG